MARKVLLVKSTVATYIEQEDGQKFELAWTNEGLVLGKISTFQVPGWIWEEVKAKCEVTEIPIYEYLEARKDN